MLLLINVDLNYLIYIVQTRRLFLLVHKIAHFLLEIFMRFWKSYICSFYFIYIHVLICLHLVWNILLVYFFYLRIILMMQYFLYFLNKTACFIFLLLPTLKNQVIFKMIVDKIIIILKISIVYLKLVIKFILIKILMQVLFNFLQNWVSRNGFILIFIVQKIE